MNPLAQTPDQLWTLWAEVAGSCHTATSTGTRNTLCIARGYLELNRDHGDLLNVTRIEELLVHASSAIGNTKFRHSFLVRLRTCAGWLRVTPKTPDIHAAA